MTRTQLLVIVLSYLWILSACSFEKEKPTTKDGYIPVTKYHLKSGDSLTSENWKCYKVKEDLICIPKVWKPLKTENLFFYAELGNLKANEFFVLLKYEHSTTHLSEYLQKAIQQFKTPGTEQTMECKIMEFLYEDNRKRYFVEFEIQDSLNTYHGYSTYFVQEDNLYNITLKYLSSKDRNEFYDLYHDILYNYLSKDKPVVDVYERIEKLRHIDLNNPDL